MESQPLSVFVGGNRDSPSIPDNGNALESTDDVGLKFRQLFTLYAFGTIVLPTSVGHIQPAYLQDVSKIRNINWATLSYNFLVEGVRKFKQNGGKYIRSCVVFLEVTLNTKYLYLCNITSSTVYVKG